MKKDVLFIQGAGQGAYQEDGELAASLQDALGTEYEIRYPKMPEENPEYGLWQAKIEKELAALDGEAILVGHSFGGSILLKHLSEHTLTKPIGGLFLIATPYWGDGGWEYDAYTLQEDFATKLKVPRIVLYHSRDDEIVEFEHLALYAEKLPQATIREFEDRGHQFKNNLVEVAEDIKKGEQ